MRVREHTPERLVLTHRPTLLVVLLGGATLAMAVALPGRWTAYGRGEIIGALLTIALAAFATVVIATWSIVVFDRATRTMRWRHRGAFALPSGKSSIDRIRGVGLEDEPMPDVPDQPSRRIVIRMARGSVPLTRHFSGVEPNEATVAAIREWLAGAGVALTDSRQGRSTGTDTRGCVADG